jgi:arylamine N-acetyltransferase
MDAIYRAAMSTDPTISDYLRRLGVEGRPPSAEALGDLHRAQIERIPYETTWIQLGEQWGIDPDASTRRIARQGRGGYCFHLNAALGRLLTALGYDVTLHVGGVHDGEPSEATMTNHLVLTVGGLPTDDNPDGIWYVDAGLGDALHEPLPLLAGTYRQGPMTFQLAHEPGEVADWHFTHDPQGSFAGMSFRSQAASMAAFDARHAHLSTSPESGFVRTVTVQRRDRDQLVALRALTLSTRRETTTTRVVADRAEWFDLLADELHLRLDGAEQRAKDLLWRHAVSAHEAHLADVAARAQAGEPTAIDS